MVKPRLPRVFRLRRSGETRAQIVATALVFTTTWLCTRSMVLASRRISPDVARYAVLGDSRSAGDGQPPLGSAPSCAAGGCGSQSWPLRALKVAVTFSVITTLWSLWNSPSVGAWLELVSWWEIG